MLPVVQKVVPVITRNHQGSTQLLVFDHPLEGQQFIKGTLEPNEDLRHAALRELQEESGISEATVVAEMGSMSFEHKDEQQHWHFFKVEPEVVLKERWDHFAQEEEGMWFKLYWQNIDQPIHTPWPWVYDRSRLFIRDWLLTSSDSLT